MSRIDAGTLDGLTIGRSEKTIGLKNMKNFFGKTSLVYDQCVKCAGEFEKYPEKRIVELMFDDLPDYKDVRLYEFYAMDINRYLIEVKNIDNSYYLDYNGKKIMFLRRINSMKYEFNVEIPYAERSKYRDFIVEVNHLVSLSGVLSLWVNNNPYSLQSFLVIETAENGEEISRLVKKYGLKNDSSKGLSEYMLELGSRQWNTITISPGDKYIDVAFGLYHFAEEEYLNRKGFKKDDIKRKKVFVSYCHADKEIVLSLVDKMEKAGLYLWLDKQEIDAGDSILEKVMSGIEESDLCITFISKTTIEAQFARHELKTIWHKVIYNQKKWFIAKLDDVDVEKVYSGLNQYLYYEVQNIDMAEEFIKAIKKKINKLV